MHLIENVGRQLVWQILPRYLLMRRHPKLCDTSVGFFRPRPSASESNNASATSNRATSKPQKQKQRSVKQPESKLLLKAEENKKADSSEKECSLPKNEKSFVGAAPLCPNCSAEIMFKKPDPPKKSKWRWRWKFFN